MSGWLDIELRAWLPGDRRRAYVGERLELIVVVTDVGPPEDRYADDYAVTLRVEEVDEL